MTHVLEDINTICQNGKQEKQRHTGINNFYENLKLVRVFKLKSIKKSLNISSLGWPNMLKNTQ